MSPKNQPPGTTPKARPMDPDLRVALLGASAPMRNQVKLGCEAIGLHNCTEFTFAHELIPILKVSACHVLITTGEIGDLHWATFFRTLRSDPKIPFVPALFIPSSTDSTVKQHVELLKSLHVSLMQPMDAGAPVPTGLRDAVTQVVYDERSLGKFAAKLNEAKEFYRSGLKIQAQRIFRALAKEKPTDTIAKIGLVQTSAADDKNVLAEIQSLIASDPANYCFWFELLNHLLASENISKFELAFDSLSAELRTASESYWLFHLASMCLSLRQPRFAARCVSMLEEAKSPNCDWMPYYIRARLYLVDSQIEKASRELDQAVAHCKFFSAEFHNLAGIIAKRQTRPEPALAAFREAAEMAPLDFRIQYNLALAHLELDEKPMALAALNKALEIYPKYSRAAAKLQEMS